MGTKRLARRRGAIMLFLVALAPLGARAQSAQELLPGFWECAAAFDGVAMTVRGEYYANGTWIFFGEGSGFTADGRRTELAVYAEGGWRIEGDVLVEQASLSRVLKLGVDGVFAPPSALGRGGVAAEEDAVRSDIVEITETELVMLQSGERIECRRL